MLVTESRPGQNRHAGGSSASACNSHRIADSCVQGRTASDPPRVFFTALQETFHSRLTSSYKYMRDGAQRVAGVYALPARRTRVALFFLLIPGITEKPGEVESRGKKIPAACDSGPCSDHRPSPRRLHVPAGCIEGGMAWTQQCKGAL